MTYIMGIVKDLRKKVLVTGGAGFIGSHLCERLVALDEYEVYSLDNYFTGSIANHVPGVDYIRGNTSDIDVLIDFQPAILFHLGEYSRVEQSFRDIDLVWKFNKESIIAVLKFVRDSNCKLVYAGSSTKFGDNGTGSRSSPYAWVKASNTDFVVNYSKWFNIDYAITYFYNAYGGRELMKGEYATLIGIYKEKIRNQEILPIVSPGTQQRNFTHVDDIVDGLIAVGKHGIGDEFGIGSHEAYTVLEVAEMFGGKIQMLPERKGNRMRADVLTEKTKALGWSPKRSLREYIEDCKSNGWK